jgi:phosphatidate cytidylyltransferase
MAKQMGNLPTRVIAALIGIPLIVAVCLIGKLLFLVFALAIGLVSFWEYSKMLKTKQTFTNKFIGYLAVGTVIINEYKYFADYRLLFLLIILLLLIIELFRNNHSAIFNVGSTLLGIFYIGFFSSTLVSLREFYGDSAFTYSQGGYLILSILVSIWICDSAAYFIGSAYGRHRLMPRVSPKKSWEGAVAGFVFAVAAIIAAHSLVMEFMSLTDAIVIGIIVGVFGQIGDLIESLVKRDAHVKDSSSIIPGHGGMFDRFDSLLFTVPIVYLYLTLLR